MNKVIVIMSTYNGEKYLQEQIDSVLDQKDVDVELWVRDDGSSDETVNILRELEKQEKIRLVEGNNIGYRKSFMSLLHMVPEADYYAFCDQDDIWVENKLIKMINAIEHYDGPAIGISDLQMMDAEKNMIQMDTSTFPVEYDKLSREALQKLVSIETILIGYGCTQVWNKSLQELAKQNKYETTINHDYILGILGIFTGNFVAVNEKLIFYRQHGNNTSGNRIGIQKIRTILSRHVETLTKKRFDTISYVDREMINNYGHVFNSEGLSIIKKVAFYNESWENQKTLLQSDFFSGLRFWDKVKTKMKILLGVL